jgi:hypothetical protein
MFVHQRAFHRRSLDFFPTFSLTSWKLGSPFQSQDLNQETNTGNAQREIGVACHLRSPIEGSFVAEVADRSISVMGRRSSIGETSMDQSGFEPRIAFKPTTGTRPTSNDEIESYLKNEGEGCTSEEQTIDKRKEQLTPSPHSQSRFTPSARVNIPPKISSFPFSTSDSPSGLRPLRSSSQTTRPWQRLEDMAPKRPPLRRTISYCGNDSFSTSPPTKDPYDRISNQLYQDFKTRVTKQEEHPGPIKPFKPWYDCAQSDIEQYVGMRRRLVKQMPRNKRFPMVG